MTRRVTYRRAGQERGTLRVAESGASGIASRAAATAARRGSLLGLAESGASVTTRRATAAPASREHQTQPD